MSVFIIYSKKNCAKLNAAAVLVLLKLFTVFEWILIVTELNVIRFTQKPAFLHFDKLILIFVCHNWFICLKSEVS